MDDKERDKKTTQSETGVSYTVQAAREAESANNKDKTRHSSQRVSRVVTLKDDKNGAARKEQETKAAAWMNAKKPYE